MTPTWLRILPYIAALALVAGSLFGAYLHGVTVTDTKWLSAWHQRDADDKAAALENESRERVREQAYQQSINKAVQDGQRFIDQATADAAAARATAGSVQLAADNLARRLATSEASGHSCTSAASQAVARDAAMLADVLKRADQRAGDLAAIADQARARGVTCEQAYDGLIRSSALH
jgi:hypothetical protein